MKPFDLAAAQRGDGVQYDYGNGEFSDVHFVGVKKGGEVVFHHTIGSPNLFCPKFELLRMAPKPPKEMWVQLYWYSSVGIKCTSPFESPDEARAAVNSCKPIGEPQKVLVPEDA